MKIDPYKHKERYFAWKERVEKEGIPKISKANSDLILRYILDMEHGINVSLVAKKGSRSYTRLNTLKDRIRFFAIKFKEIYGLDKITDISEEQLLLFFSRMRNGEIKREDGKNYVYVTDFVKVFKAFWHWYEKVSKKQGKKIMDITTDLDTSGTKPQWVYLTEEQVKKLCESVKPDYRVLIMFLFDSGIRSPTELVNVRVSDFYDNFKEAHIREEVSKTFGRRIKLMLCSSLIREYCKEKNLQLDDYVFPINPVTVNQYLKRLAKRVFGDEMSPAGQKYSDLTMYDFRHISCCYWLPRYKSESALKYRFGWKKSDKIHYYSELLGMRDTISEEDLLIDVTKTEIEKRLTIAERDNALLKDQVANMQEQMQKILGVVGKQYIVLKENC